MSHGTNESRSFDIDKAIEVVAYFVEQGVREMYTIMKMVYVADKLHLERYGRFIAGDSYAAMKEGPVPSNTYNMIKHVRGDSGYGQFARASELLSYEADHIVGVKRAVAFDELSASDLACLEEVVSIYRRVGKWAVRDMSHDTAWTRAWRGKTLFTKSASMSMELIAQELGASDELIRHLHDPNPGEAQEPAQDEGSRARKYG